MFLSLQCFSQLITRSSWMPVALSNLPISVSCWQPCAPCPTLRVSTRFSNYTFLPTNLICLQICQWKTHNFSSSSYFYITIVTVICNHLHISLVFSARQHICYSALFAIARPSVCLSVCLSRCLSHGWISQRQLQLGSRNLHHRVAPWL